MFFKSPFIIIWKTNIDIIPGQTPNSVNKEHVPRTGLEPAHLTELPPQSSVSTNFTTWALKTLQNTEWGKAWPSGKRAKVKRFWNFTNPKQTSLRSLFLWYFLIEVLNDPAVLGMFFITKTDALLFRKENLKLSEYWTFSCFHHILLPGNNLL